MMKAALLFSLVIFTTGLSFGQEKKGYEISISVANLNTNKVFLNTMKHNPANNLYWPVVDSALVINGKATLKRDTVLAEPSWSSGIYYMDSVSRKRTELVFKSKYKIGGKHLNFILENTRMQITGNAKDLSGLEIEGSPETDLYMRYGLLMPNTRTINRKIDDARKNKNKALLSAALSAKNDSLISFRKMLNRLTEQHPSSWVMLLNVYQNASIFNPAALAEITAKFNKALLSTPKGKALTNFTKQSTVLVRGADFPAFTYPDANGQKVTLNDVKGKRGTLVIFWASWCGPCRQEIPALKKVYQKYKEKGINLVSISTDHDIAAWKLALKQEAMPWINLSNLPGDNKQINSVYNIYAIPSAFLLDAENKIVMPDEYRIEVIKENLDKLLRD